MSKESVIDVKRVITKLRERGHSTAAIRRMAGVDFTTIWRWENGKVEPKLDAVNRLLKALNGD